MKSFFYFQSCQEESSGAVVRDALGRQGLPAAVRGLLRAVRQLRGEPVRPRGDGGVRRPVRDEAHQQGLRQDVRSQDPSAPFLFSRKHGDDDEGKRACAGGWQVRSANAALPRRVGRRCASASCRVPSSGFDDLKLDRSPVRVQASGRTSRAGCGCAISAAAGSTTPRPIRTAGWASMRARRTHRLKRRRMRTGGGGLAARTRALRPMTSSYRYCTCSRYSCH